MRYASLRSYMDLVWEAVAVWRCKIANKPDHLAFFQIPYPWKQLSLSRYCVPSCPFSFLRHTKTTGQKIGRFSTVKWFNLSFCTPPKLLSLSYSDWFPFSFCEEGSVFGLANRLERATRVWCQLYRFSKTPRTHSSYANSSPMTLIL